MEIQLIVVLVIAFIVLGPERMMSLAVKLGEATRKVREIWDEVRMQAYMEEMNKKVLEEESKQKELDDRTEDETIDNYEEVDEPLPDIEAEDYEDMEDIKEESVADEHGEQSAPNDAVDGTPEGAENKTN